MNIRQVFHFNRLMVRSFSNATSKTEGKTPSSNPKPTSVTVSGLSEKCVKANKEPVGPGASVNGDYKVPEYFCYDKMSFAEAEIEMAKYRCPQPSAR